MSPDPSPELDLLVIARVNTVAGHTAAHIQKWKWRVDEAGHVNFPDRQGRIYRNCDAIRWVNRVHEAITGYKVFSHLPLVPEFALIHPKSIERQEKGMALYEKIGNPAR